MHFVFAIPTFNRVFYLKKNITALLNQNLNSKVKISICVSNTASSDDTMNYLNNLKETNENVIINNKKLENENENPGSLASIIPIDADWVWYLGDDDILINDDALLKVADVIENNDIDFIHVSQYRRSNRNDELIHNSNNCWYNFFHNSFFTYGCSRWYLCGNYKIISLYNFMASFRSIKHAIVI